MKHIYLIFNIGQEREKILEALKEVSFITILSEKSICKSIEVEMEPDQEFIDKFSEQHQVYFLDDTENQDYWDNWLESLPPEGQKIYNEQMAAKEAYEA